MKSATWSNATFAASVGCTGGRARSRAVRLWRLNKALERLASFLDDSIIHCPAGPDGWLEDLTVHRRRELVLGLVSHEREGVLRLSSRELDEVSALDIPFERTSASVDF